MSSTAEQQGVGSSRHWPRWVVVGVSGVTCSGKTTLSLSLSALPSTVVYLTQDEYILPNDHPDHLKAPEEVGGINKESLASVDMIRMLRDIRRVLATDPMTLTLRDYREMLDRSQAIGSALRDPRPPLWGRSGEPGLPAVLVLDGFLLFNHPQVPPLCHLRFFITLTREQCLARRNKRPATSSFMNSQQYFDLCVWPKYEEHFMEMCNSVTNVHFLDGATLSDTCDEKVLRVVKEQIFSLQTVNSI